MECGQDVIGVNYRKVSPREVRLRTEFAGLYENMPAGSWLPASVWAEGLVTRARRARQLRIHQRTFNLRHFEFRGGPEPRRPFQRQPRTRAEDRLGINWGDLLW
jgi:hypothetical protein